MKIMPWKAKEGKIMKVLFQIRPDFARNPAGDTVQLANTKKYLEKQGVKVDISTSMMQSYRGYDLVHLFNLTRAVETYYFAYKAFEYGIPIVLSTIYWDNSYYYRCTTLPAWKKRAWEQQKMLRRIILSKASILLPNSQVEMDMLRREFGIEKPYRIVPNCVDERFSGGNKERFVKDYGIKDFVLCVGRISPRKNQLALIEALRGTGLKLVFVGPVNDSEYGRKCMEAAGHNALFIQRQNSEQLRDCYAAASVHVLPSWFETPGLANLEAAAAGCEVVTTRYGSTYEYFGELAYYCLPEDRDSIREAVLRALEGNNGAKLQELVLRKYTWDKAAGETLRAYREVLKR